jgi:hypothetical protein
MSNRQSGILTPTDSEFLHNVPDHYEGDNARQSRYQRRRDIRRRIVSSLLDFQEINTYLNDEERRKIFAAPEKNGAEGDTEFHAALQSLLQWIYLGFREEGLNFERIVTNAVKRAEEDYQRIHTDDIVEVDVDFDVETSAKYDGVEKIARALEEGDRLFARNLYTMPKVSTVPVDPEKVDVVRIQPESGSIRPEREKAIVDVILQEHLGIDAEIEIVGNHIDKEELLKYTEEGEDYEEPTAAVDRDEYRVWAADNTDM